MQVPPVRSCSYKKTSTLDVAVFADNSGTSCARKLSKFLFQALLTQGWGTHADSAAWQEDFSLRMARAINFKFACILQTCILSEATSWWQTICQISSNVCTAFGVDGHWNETPIKTARKSLILQEPALPTQLGQDLSFLLRYKSCRKTSYCLLASVIHASCLGHEIVSVIWVIWTTASEGWKHGTVKINLATSQK